MVRAGTLCATCKTLEGIIKEAIEGGLNGARGLPSTLEKHKPDAKEHSEHGVHIPLFQVGPRSSLMPGKDYIIIGTSYVFTQIKVDFSGFPFNHVQLFKLTCSYKIHPMIPGQVHDPIVGHKFVWEPLGGNSRLGGDR